MDREHEQIVISEGNNMPVHKSYKNGQAVGWRWGRSGKVYATRAEAERQARAIYASGYRK